MLGEVRGGKFKRRKICFIEGSKKAFTRYNQVHFERLIDLGLSDIKKWDRGPHSKS